MYKYYDYLIAPALAKLIKTKFLKYSWTNILSQNITQLQCADLWGIEFQSYGNYKT
jgi:hypothetical protein